METLCSPGAGGGAETWYTIAPAIRKPTTSSNSRLPIDLESDLVVEFAGKSGRSWTGPTERPPDFNPDCTTHAASCSNGTYISAHDRAAGVCLQAHGFRRRVVRDTPRRPRVARPGGRRDRPDVWDESVAVAVAPGADWPDAVHERLHHDGHRLCGERAAPGTGGRGAAPVPARPA